jgi:predicted transcriptional regulator
MLGSPPAFPDPNAQSGESKNNEALGNLRESEFCVQCVQTAVGHDMPKRTTKSTTVTARISPPLARKIEAYAKLAGRTKSWIVEDILGRYVDQEKAFAEAVRDGLRELDAGQAIPHDEVFSKLREKSAERRKALRRKAA